MAVGPLACRLRRHVLAAADAEPERAAGADSGLAAAVRGWGRGYCPACGSWPALAELGAGDPGGGAATNVDAKADSGDGMDAAGAAGAVADAGRRLRCSFCGAGWPCAPGACIYCGAGGEGLLAAAGAGEAQRAELCRSCGGYLKCLAGGAPAPFELLPVIDLETSDLDAGAMERGYGRPSMRETDAPAPPCPPAGEADNPPPG